MKQKLLICLTLLFFLFVPAKTVPASVGITGKIDNVVSVSGRCSGGYFHLPAKPSMTFVLTAAHCVSPFEPFVEIRTNEESVYGILILVDDLSDYAVIQVYLKTMDSDSFRVVRRPLRLYEEVKYAGNTLSMESISLSGKIANRYSYYRYLVNSFCWFGLSGSPIYTVNGEVAGVVSSLPVGQEWNDVPIFGLMSFGVLPKNLAKQIKDARSSFGE